VPIPTGKKGPTLDGWPDLRLTAVDAGSHFASGMLVGVLHDNVLVLDIDIYDHELAALVLADARRRFPGALVRIGQAPKAALVFRMDEPGFTMPSTRKLYRGKLSALVEVRSGHGRQFVAYGVHPDTGHPYTWPEGELWATSWCQLPAADETAVREFRDWAAERIRRWAGVEDDKKVVDLAAARADRDERPAETEFLEALRRIPPALPYDDWLPVLMGIHDFFGGSARGLEVAKSWSSPYPDYSAREVESKWRSFDTGGGVGYRSVFKLAQQHGADLAAIARQQRPAQSFDFDFGHLAAGEQPAAADDPWGDPPPPRDNVVKPAAWKVQRADAFIADFVPPEYLIEGVIQRGRIYTLTAPTGAGKTAAMLYASTCIQTGAPFCGREVEQGDVLFLAGENPDDVRARTIATLEFYGIAPECGPHFIPGTFSIRRDIEAVRAEAAALADLACVVVDTYAAYFDGDDENNNAQALDFARLLRRLTQLPGRPAVIVPSHPVKGATRQTLTPKGGSSLLNEVDSNLTLWNEEGVVSMHWQGKHRGPDFEPLRMELQPYQSERLRDHRGRSMPTILAKPILELRAQQMIRETLSLEDRLLLDVETHPASSLAERCMAVGLMGAKGPKRTNLIRLLGRLQKQKLIKRFRTNWELTPGGEKAVEMIHAGEPLAEEEA
jgi:hypothetical protein